MERIQERESQAVIEAMRAVMGSDEGDVGDGGKNPLLNLRNCGQDRA
jgi:hypothetical protein